MTPAKRSRLTPLVLIGLLAWGCGGDDGGTDPATTGTVRVSVSADGSAESGITVRLYPDGGTSSSATEATGSDGIATFSDVPEGTHAVEIDVPTGFSLATGETDRKSVTVAAGATTNAAFAVVEDDPEEDVVEITAANLTVSDDDIIIAPGTTVRWSNGDGVFHTVTPDGHSEWSSADLGSGATFEHTFDEVGDFPYYCTPHQGQGMTGIIRVESP